MAPPPPSATSRAASLLLRVLAFACLVVSIVLLATNAADLEVDLTNGFTALFKIKFKDVYAYRYMLSAIVIGLAYTLLQLFLTVYNVSMGNRLITGDESFTFDFYGDKIMSYVMATGAAAGFGVTKDLKETVVVIFPDSASNIDKFFNKGHVSASLLLIAFVCTAIMSVISSYALPKRV